jgi:glutathione S-transferase
MTILMRLFTISGEKPGMVDYMFWPWGERLGSLKKVAGDQFVLPKERFPRLVSYHQHGHDSPSFRRFRIPAE